MCGFCRPDPDDRAWAEPEADRDTFDLADEYRDRQKEGA